MIKSTLAILFLLAALYPAGLLYAGSNPMMLDILIQKNVVEINIKSARGAEISFDKNKERINSTELKIVPSEDGITINGSSYPDMLVIAPVKPGFLTVWEKGGRTYDGVMILKSYNGKLDLINRVGLEDYVASVVASEISPKWHDEVLKAQAVASRTYAIYKIKKNPYLSDTTSDQVYHGRNNINNAVRKAVETTRGLIVTYKGKPAMTVFHSTTVGYTETAKNVWHTDLPYLISVQCPSDKESPLHSWERSFPVKQVEKALRQAEYKSGFLAAMTPFKWSATGRVQKIRIITSKGEGFLTGEELRKVLGYSALPSTMFRITEMNRQITFAGNGYGHGVGLCQYGAKKMADDGIKYKKILEHYYPNTKLKRIKS